MDKLRVPNAQFVTIIIIQQFNFKYLTIVVEFDFFKLPGSTDCRTAPSTETRRKFAISWKTFATHTWTFTGIGWPRTTCLKSSVNEGWTDC